jgi:hypothetical protein
MFFTFSTERQGHPFQHQGRHHHSPFGGFPFFADFFGGPNMFRRSPADIQAFMQGGQNKPKPPASQDVVKALPECVPPPATTCTVCLEDFESDERGTQLPCNHYFHKECLSPWLKEHNSCPTCRHQLPTDDDEYNQDHGLQHPQSFAVDTEVRIVGLRARPELNGQLGVVNGPRRNGRIPVQLPNSDVILLVRPSNLEAPQAPEAQDAKMSDAAEVNINEDIDTDDDDEEEEDAELQAALALSLRLAEQHHPVAQTETKHVIKTPLEDQTCLKDCKSGTACQSKRGATHLSPALHTCKRFCRPLDADANVATSAPTEASAADALSAPNQPSP